MDYHELSPKDRDDLAEQTSLFLSALKYIGLPPLTLICSGNGSGKSTIIKNIAKNIYAINIGITYVVLPNGQLLQQLMKVIDDPNYVRILGASEDAERQIEKAIRDKKYPIVFFSNLGSSDNKWLSGTLAFKNLLEHFHREHVKQMVVIDELDLKLTNQTGSINSKIEHTEAHIHHYMKIVEQNDYSLNIFDMMRKCDAKCIGLSATMNNVMCSKLTSLAYKGTDISVVNIFPIKELYDKLQIQKLDIDNYKNLVPFILNAKQKILIVFNSEAEIKKFIQFYETHFQEPIQYVKITAQNESERSTPKFLDDMRRAKFGFGIDIITTGFDISTYVHDEEFSLGILYRNLSDKVSQPLSKNDKNPLHMEASARFIQTLSRLRKGGIFLIRETYKGHMSLYDLQVQVSQTIKDGLKEFGKVGPPKLIQSERDDQGRLLALIQNLRSAELSSQRPIVDKILKDLNFDNRNLIEELKSDVFDYEYWINIIGKQWEIYALPYQKDLTEEERAQKKAEIIANAKNQSLKKGGGFKDSRYYDERVLEEVIARSNGICGHCSKPLEDPENRQICHIRRHDSGGSNDSNNLIYGHKHCDSTYDDAGLYVIEPSGGYWVRNDYAVIIQPDWNQFKYIANENIQARWDWEFSKERWRNKYSVELLREKDYVFVPAV